MFPSKNAFSKITSELCFDGNKLNSTLFSIVRGPLGSDDSEFTSVLDMRGVAAGLHVVGVELFVLGEAGDRLAVASREVAVDFVPVRREDRLIRIPIVKSVAGADLVVVSDSEKDIYREIAKDVKREEISRRDEW